MHFLKGLQKTHILLLQNLHSYVMIYISLDAEGEMGKSERQIGKTGCMFFPYAD